jgi:hypothetical protein
VGDAGGEGGGQGRGEDWVGAPLVMVWSGGRLGCGEGRLGWGREGWFGDWSCTSEQQLSGQRQGRSDARQGTRQARQGSRPEIKFC